VERISIRGLSTYGDDGSGGPEYGLRFFTADPGGEIPIHSHFYHQTKYILSGRIDCWEFDSDTDDLVQSTSCGPGDSAYVPSFVPHGMKNVSDTEPASFLCRICNVYEGESL
jgi:quercetin dioxygenase-like cupin family protein